MKKADQDSVRAATFDPIINIIAVKPSFLL